MRIVYEPKVYLVERPSVVQEGLEAFLEEQGLDWPTPMDGTDAETVVELAGRNCYMSFGQKAGSKTNFDYIQNLLGRGKDGNFRPGPAHGCYDSETEVLTSNGWKYWEDVTYNDELATLNKKSQIEYHKPSKLINYHHNGRMFRVEGKGVDLLVTPDHKMYTCITTTKDGRKKENFDFIQASDINNKSHAYFKGGGLAWDPSSEFIDDNCWDTSKFALLGFTIGDGTVYNDSCSIRFNIRLERKISYLKRLAQLCGYEFKENKYNFVVNVSDSFIELFRQIYDEDGNKIIPQKLFKLLPKDSLFALYDGLLQSDGSFSNNGGAVYDTTSEVLAGQFQQLCLHIGLAANISQAECYTEDYRSNSSSMGNNRLYRIHVIRDKYLKPEFNKFDKHKSKTYWVDDWDGEVYCAEVPNHTLYVRRNGKTVWSGNSVVEHPNWTFVIVGAGRGFSHEQVRHRVGVAYSQLSTRYCDFEREEEEGTWDPGFVVPPLAQLDPLTKFKFEEKIEQSREAYKELLNLIMDDLSKHDGFKQTLSKYPPQEQKRMLRKAARGAARDILPICTEAIMTISENARTIWNTIVQRANEQAEAVIRSIYVQIARIMEKEMPSLFYGLEYYEAWDGSTCVRMPREKL